uniref:Uncharacterized protein n=1 Tax=Arundo donax TaxID=35708 RepID=A0A0A9S8Z2_ARUDO
MRNAQGEATFQGDLEASLFSHFKLLKAVLKIL